MELEGPRKKEPVVKYSGGGRRMFLLLHLLSAGRTKIR